MNQSQTQFDNNNFGEALIMQQTLPTSESFPVDSILPIPRPPGYSNGFSTSYDASGNQNHPESIPPIPWNSILMNQSQTQFDNNNFGEDLIMQQTLPTSENFLSDSFLPPIPCSSFYSNESINMIDASFNGPSMPHYSFENLSAPDGEESPPGLWNH
ncbi:hypothetical protein MRB53_021638 [Persea americana]|uniref:Uncharacterized protein n=1 Tax=Persea americana TaxID=3435 RepID=A0ACC2L487_PERAE|nr:hypothetical protein MRB53_021638 [Persea americana]